MITYGVDRFDLDLWCDRDDRVHSGVGPYQNRPLRWLRRRLAHRRAVSRR